MALGTREDAILTEWRLETGQAVKSVDELAKAIRAEQRDEKKLALVRGELDKITGKASTSTKKFTTETKKLSKANEGLASSFTSSFTKASLLASAITFVAREVKDLLKETSAFTQATNIFTGNITSARAATQGLATDLEIMTAGNRLATLGVKLTDEGFNELLGSLTKLSAAMGIEFASAIESATIALARNSVRVADNIGVVLKLGDVNRDAAVKLGVMVTALTAAQQDTAFDAAFLDQVRKKAAGLPERTQGLTEDLKKLWVWIKNDTLQTLKYVDVNVALTKSWVNASGALDGLGSRLEEHNRTIEETAELTAKLNLEGAGLLGFAGGRGRGAGAAGPTQPGGGAFGGTTGPRGIFAPGAGVPTERMTDREREGFIAAIKKIVAARRGKGGGPGFTQPRIDVFEEDADISPFGQLGGADQPGGSFQDQLNILGQLSGNAVRYRIDIEDLAAAIDAMGKATARATTNGLGPFANKVQAAKELARQFGEEANSIAGGAMVNFTTGMLQAADAAIQSGAPFQDLALKMLKSVTLGLASQLFAKGVAAKLEAAALASNPLTIGLAPFFAAQGALYLKGAAVVAGLGLGLSAATAGGGGGGGRGGGGGGRSASATFGAGGGGRSPRRQEPERGPTHITLEITSKDPVMKQKLLRELKVELDREP